VPTIPWRRTATIDPDTNYLLMASRLPLRSIAKVPWFLGLTASVVRQLERTHGLVGYSLRAHPFARNFWTLSAWTDARALAEFVRDMPHQGVMAKLRPHMDPTRFATWTVPGSALPVPWAVAIGHLDSSSSRAPMTPPAPRPTDHTPTPTHLDKELPS
jgi:hypothetical protein